MVVAVQQLPGSDLPLSMILCSGVMFPKFKGVSGQSVRAHICMYMFARLSVYPLKYVSTQVYTHVHELIYLLSHTVCLCGYHIHTCTGV